MDWYLLLTLIIMLIGMAGTFLPVLPGIPVIFLAMLAFDWVNRFSVLGAHFLLAMFVLAVFSMVAEYFSGVFGAQRYGASKLGKAGALIGGLLGIVLMGPAGIVLGPLAGVLMGELLSGKGMPEAVRSGWGVLLGLIAGTAVKSIIAITMIVLFCLRVLT
ncbi:MAG: DUF456 family protein [Syntrophomonadaceae bacterium]|nr:DUF456 family protein [Syntrophomonadaceae bacterium]